VGYKFLRQRPVMNYIADFMCPELMLIIEVDGASHKLEGADRKDAFRQRKLEDAGFTVIRLEDNAVLNNMSWIQSYLAQEVARLAGQREYTV
jgi:very-short-patch-repair endonuclease